MIIADIKNRKSVCTVWRHAHTVPWMNQSVIAGAGVNRCAHNQSYIYKVSLFVWKMQYHICNNRLLIYLPISKAALDSHLKKNTRRLFFGFPFIFFLFLYICV